MFELNEEQRIIQKSVHDFAKKELAPKASHWDVHEEFPWDLGQEDGRDRSHWITSANTLRWDGS